MLTCVPHLLRWHGMQEVRDRFLHRISSILNKVRYGFSMTV